MASSSSCEPKEQQNWPAGDFTDAKSAWALEERIA